MSSSASTKASNQSTNKYKNGIHQLKNAFIVRNNTNQHSTVTMEEMNILLKDEIISNKKDVWVKLNRKSKCGKLKQFANDFAIEKSLLAKQKEDLEKFLLDAIEQKKLLRAKEIDYNKEMGKIISIPSLVYNKTNGSFSFHR